jgi:hypothetical protein
MIDSVAQEHNEETIDKEEPDFFEEHTDNVNNKADQSPVVPIKKVGNFFIGAGSGFGSLWYAKPCGSFVSNA